MQVENAPTKGQSPRMVVGKISQSFRRSKKVIIGLLLIIICIAVIIFVLVKRQSIPSGWTEYKNTQAGFSFIYPKAWGKPAYFPEIKASGQPYSIDFSSNVNSSGSFKIVRNVSLAMESDDLVHVVCTPPDSNYCTNIPAYSKTTLQKILAKDKSKFVKYDKDFYAAVASQSGGGGLSSGLAYNEVVDLPKIKVSAAQISYFISTNNTFAKCPDRQLSSDVSNTCVTTANYNDVRRFARSIKAT